MILVSRLEALYQNKVSLLKQLLICFSVLSLVACGGGASDESPSGNAPPQEEGQKPKEDNDTPDYNPPDFEIPENEKAKAFLRTDLTFSTSHSSVPSSVELYGVKPTLSLGQTTLHLSRRLQNGWATRRMVIRIADADGVDGQYTCTAGDNTSSPPVLAERDCFIKFESDSYVGDSQSWFTDPSSCTININNAVFDGVFYEEFDISINCQNMVNVFQFEELYPVPEGADIDSLLNITGRVFASSESGKPIDTAEYQTVNASLTVSGGDGIIDSNLSFESIGGISDVSKSYSGSFKTNDEVYEINLYLNAAYDVGGEFECVNPPLYLGTSPQLYLDDSECLLTITKNDPEFYAGWTWDSRDGGNCIINVSSARVTFANTLYDFQAQIDCPNMVSRAITYDHTYPNDVKPSNLNVQGSFDFVEVF